MMNKNNVFKRLATLLLAAAVACPAEAGLLTATGVEVLDASGGTRASFSNNEKIRMQARVNNASASTNFIRFTFTINNPAGSQVFRHAGNAVPGRVGNAATQVSGLPIERIFTGPGIYTLISTAELDGLSVSQSQTFTVSSPNILLLYPPNGAQGITDKPLTFRWNSSGATKYRITVGETPSFFNSVFTETTAGGAVFFSYPDNPADSRARLASDTIYYWKIEGLDANGNVVAQSDVPYSFSVGGASLTRDLAITSLSVISKQGLSIKFRATVSNQGGTTESNIPLKFSLGGEPAPGSPLTMPSLQPGDKLEYDFTVLFPEDQAQNLAIACLEFFDDSVTNNCKSMQVDKPPVEGGDGGAIFNEARQLTKTELWDAISKLLQSRGLDFGDYGLVDIDQTLTSEDLQALLDELQRGLVDVDVTGPPADAEPPPDYIPPPVSGGPNPGSEAPDLVIDNSSDEEGAGAEATSEEAKAAEQERAAKIASMLGRDWKGMAPAMSGRNVKLILRSKNGLEKFWNRVSNEDAPEIDFKLFMLVGIVAGSRERANGLEIEEVRETPRGLQVSYQMMVDAMAKAGQERASVPFHLMVIPQSGLAVDFKKVNRNRGVGFRPPVAKKPDVPKTAKEQAGKSDAETWAAVKSLLLNGGLDFSDYALVEVKPQLSLDDFGALVLQLKNGKAETEVLTR